MLCVFMWERFPFESNSYLILCSLGARAHTHNARTETAGDRVLHVKTCVSTYVVYREGVTIDMRGWGGEGRFKRTYKKAK